MRMPEKFVTTSTDLGNMGFWAEHRYCGRLGGRWFAIVGTATRDFRVFTLILQRQEGAPGVPHIDELALDLSQYDLCPCISTWHPERHTSKRRKALSARRQKKGRACH